MHRERERTIGMKSCVVKCGGGRKDGGEVYRRTELCCGVEEEKMESGDSRYLKALDHPGD